MREIVTLQQILDNREARADYQQILLRGYGTPLVSFMVNMPGAVKRNPAALAVHRAGITALREGLAGHILYYKTLDYPTGYEGFFAVDLPGEKVKDITCRIEDTHPLGRLMDLDVLTPDGGSISRVQLGLPPRACLICGGYAKACARSKAHALSALYEKIAALTGEVCP